MATGAPATADAGDPAEHAGGVGDTEVAEGGSSAAAVSETAPPVAVRESTRAETRTSSRGWRRSVNVESTLTRAPAQRSGGKFDTQRASVIGETALLMGGISDEDEATEAQKEVLRSRRRSFGALIQRNTKRSVTPDEMRGVREYIMTEIADRNQTTLAKLSATNANLQEEIRKLRSEMQAGFDHAERQRQRRADEATKFTVECCTRVSQELDATRMYLEDRMHNGFEHARNQLFEAQVLNHQSDQRLEQHIEHRNAELSGTMAVRWASTCAMLERLQTACEENLSNFAADTSARFKETAQKARDETEACRTELIEKEDGLGKRISKNSELLQDLIRDIKGDVDQRTADSENRQSASERYIAQKVREIQADADNRIRAMEAETRRLFTVVSEVENIPTRRVEWLIKDASNRLVHGSEAAWLSPRFEAAGAHGLQLELLLLDPASAEAAEENAKPYGPMGDALIHLWTEDSGLRLVCKLCIGEAFEQVNHTFDGTSPCKSRPICYLRDQINREDDTLKVSLEILESVREVENLKRPWSMEAEGARPVLDGPVTSHRYLNHRTLELVQTQVDLMRSRMVRRIEWRLEQASVLQRCFLNGESLCSTQFEAAGVGNMQLIFYPSGYSGVKDGYCSLFLYCPGGSALRCWLCAGKQRREAKLAFEEAGFFGRTNFCRYENCINPDDDTVLLVLEIDEAQQCLTEAMWHQTPVRGATAGTGAQDAGGIRTTTVGTSPSGDQRAGDRGGTGTPEAEAVPLPPVETIGSSVKLRRAPGRVALEDVRQLPSIWTPRPQGDLSEALEGFHSFSELKIKKPPGSARGGRPAGAFGPPPEKIAPRYMMYAG
eukprot:TRINITY_DN5470_c0_g1_i1.p1 TRINITY_DN5470_c0_g1~~TRINITY_DN5470_c0_g1_i1.p1  ORF type:complete len:839 (+),score=196.04 TRINITY_DN5470_c0_g1_i1:85-2601(+)